MDGGAKVARRNTARVRLKKAAAAVRGMALNKFPRGSETRSGSEGGEPAMISPRSEGSLQARRSGGYWGQKEQHAGCAHVFPTI